jgi:voltage-gated potassium channel
MNQHGESQAGPPKPSLRRRAFEIIEVGREGDHLSRLFHGVLIALIIVNVVAFTAETELALHRKYHFEFLLIEVFSVAVFTLEYFARLWVGVEMPFLNRMSPWKARLNLAARPFMLLDLAVILPFYFTFFFPLVDLRVLRLFRILKLARYSPALQSLTRVVANERRALLGTLIVTGTMLLFASTGIYLLERDEPGTPFTSVPAAAWWAMATLTTIGYGDIVPQTPEGKIFGGIVMLIGVGLFALPIAILSSGFAKETSRHDFVVSWSLLSRIPVFSKLDAKAIAELVSVLHSRSYPPSTEVVRAGAPATAMFFIAAGEVLIERPGVPVTLRVGDFFGEAAMIEHRSHRDGVTALTHVRLLKLYHEDYMRLCRIQPEIGEHIRAVAEARRQALGMDASGQVQG